MRHTTRTGSATECLLPNGARRLTNDSCFEYPRRALVFVAVALAMVTGWNTVAAQTRTAPRAHALRHGEVRAEAGGLAAWIEELRSIVASESGRHGYPSFAIVLAGRDGVVAELTRGVVGGGIAEAVTNSTLFRTGSVGKTLTDLAVMRAVERGELDLDVDVRRYLPSFAPDNPYGGSITLRHLMTHRSGLVREPPIGNYYDASSPGLEETVASLNGTVLLWRPGERTKYSNAGLAVVGRVLEKVYGRSFADVLEAEVFRPAGMATARVGLGRLLAGDSERAVDGDLLARGLMWSLDGTEWEAPLFDLGMSPAGDLYASVSDMSALLQALLSSEDRLASAHTLRRMWTPQYVPARENWQLEVGLGFSLNGNFAGRYRMARNGGAVYGFSTELALLPEEGLGVYAVAGREGANEVVKSIAHWALRAALASGSGEPIPAYEPASSSASRVAARLADCSTNPAGGRYGRFVGEFGWAHSPLVICEAEGHLYALVEWHSLYPLAALDDGSFGFPSYALFGHERLRFEMDGGVATSAVVGYGPSGVVFPRITKAGS